LGAGATEGEGGAGIGGGTWLGGATGATWGISPGTAEAGAQFASDLFHTKSPGRSRPACVS